MCLVIDTCCLSMVFDGSNKEHPKYASVVSWINGKGRMIYGGTKYNDELATATKFLPYIAELSRKGQTIQISKSRVDEIAATLKAKCTDVQFNDEHLVALVIASRCRVVCTNDRGAIFYLKSVDLFSNYKGTRRPSIYSGHKRHGKLCSDQYIVGICQEGDK